MIIAVALILIIVMWVASMIDLPAVFLASRIGQALFFIYIVIHLIMQTATARHVNVLVIADSINGYLLVGVIYSIAVFSMVRFQPDAFHFTHENNNERELMSKMFYYTFVTYTSTGYGDVIPMIPGARSFATLISATGQLYIAIIIALLVGKFSAAATKN